MAYWKSFLLPKSERNRLLSAVWQWSYIKSVVYREVFLLLQNICRISAHLWTICLCEPFFLNFAHFLTSIGFICNQEQLNMLLCSMNTEKRVCGIANMGGVWRKRGWDRQKQRSSQGYMSNTNCLQIHFDFSERTVRVQLPTTLLGLRLLRSRSE